jgi:hypothetical protein
MNNFVIIEENSHYLVIPSENYLLTVLNNEDYFLPYDSNWEFYKVYKMTPYDFINFIETTFSANIVKLKQFPYMSFYFKNKEDAELFLSDFNQKRK